jgi:nucleoside 2-deoxyribosyltransferase
MARIASLYLAGPDLFYPEGRDVLARKRLLVEAAGFRALTPDDAELVESEPSEAMARELYTAAASRLRQADALIANLTPWRGPGADPGTAFEAGFAAGLGKPVFAYMNVGTEEDAEHRHRVLVWMGGGMDADGRWRDGEQAEIEDFGLPENLMLWAEARRLYVIVTPDPVYDLTGLELCLEAVKLYAE